MDVRVKLFANLKEAVGQDEVVVSLPDVTSIATLRSVLAEHFPGMRSILPKCVFAVNQQIVSEDDMLSIHAEVAVLPPVGGGGTDSLDAESTDNVYCVLTEKELSVQRAYDALIHPNWGGTVLFCGTVREWTGEKQTSHLTYEAYRSMAIQQMQDLQRQVEADYPGVRTLMWHRLGRLELTDIAVICAAASPHRDAAFLAARTLIERLKKEVPIWKKEFYVDGQPEWRENE